MKILMLGPLRMRLNKYISGFGDEVINFQDEISQIEKCFDKINFIISYGYRHIIGKEILKKFSFRAINLHISYLPWNRGADPNLWSFLEDTPKGVSIHCIDEGIDMGPIIVQKKVRYYKNDTLFTTYERLSCCIESLFMEYWPRIRSGKIKAKPQPQGGSFHRKEDRKKYQHLLTNGWDTPVINLIGKALDKSEETKYE